MCRKTFIVAAVAVFINATLVLAHFPFVVPDSNGATAKLIMSETLQQDKEVKINLLSGIKLNIRDASGKQTPIKVSPDTEYSMSMALPGSENRLVHGVADLGVMQRGEGPANHLVYYPKTIVGNPFEEKSVLGREVPIELVPVKSAGGFKLELRVDEKPVEVDQEITVIDSDNNEQVVKTDAAGQSPEFKEAGIYGAWARSWVEVPGEINGKPFKQTRRYATLVFDTSHGLHTAAPNVQLGAPLPVKTIGKLIEPVASFGAVVSNGWLYTYGGHIAERHDYSTASVSGKFARMNLSKPLEWESLEGNTAVQGMNLAVHDGKIYRVGGMQPRNVPGTEADNYSLSEVVRYDPINGKWEKLPDLNMPRSSHDLVFIGNKLYVVGGWNMKGKGVESQWLTNMEVLDLDAKELKWTTLEQPFSRRALVVTVVDQKLLVCGGFDSDDNAKLDIDVYDTLTGSWSKIAPIPGSERNGFSPAACTIDGKVYLSVASGDLFRLSRDMKTWELVTRATPRIVHRLVTDNGQILIVGGASGPRMVDQIEAVQIGKID